MNVEPALQTAVRTQPHVPPQLRRIVLTGFMGAGKTTTGRLLAEGIGWEFLDLDVYIEARTGLSVPEIFAVHGEAHFRQLESSALASALGRQHLVLALGGGTPEVLTNRLLLEQTPATAVVFLDAPFPALFDRCMLQALNPLAAQSGSTDASPEALLASRPLLADPAIAEARFAVRRPIYRRLSRHAVKTDSLTPSETVVALLHSLTGATPAAR